MIEMAEYLRGGEMRDIGHGESMTVVVDDHLIERASELTGLTDPSALFHRALDELVRREAGRQLAAFDGADPAASAASRREE